MASARATDQRQLSLNLTGVFRKGKFKAFLDGICPVRDFLSDLTLDQCFLTVDDLSKLAKLTDVMPQLRQLSLSGNFSAKASKGVGVVVEQLLGRSRLESLVISGDTTSGLEGESLPILRAALRHPTLRRLDVSHNKIGDAGLAAATELVRESTTLQSIAVETIGVKHLDGLKSFLSACASSESLIDAPFPAADAAARGRESDDLFVLRGDVNVKLWVNRYVEVRPITSPIMLGPDAVLAGLVPYVTDIVRQQHAMLGMDMFGADGLDEGAKQWADCRYFGYEVPIGRVVESEKDARVKGVREARARSRVRVSARAVGGNVSDRIAGLAPRAQEEDSDDDRLGEGVQVESDCDSPHDRLGGSSESREQVEQVVQVVQVSHSVASSLPPVVIRVIGGGGRFERPSASSMPKVVALPRGAPDLAFVGVWPIEESSEYSEGELTAVPRSRIPMDLLNGS
jgi:hypothetical protein